jgi:hypothetical protein
MKDHAASGIAYASVRRQSDRKRYLEKITPDESFQNGRDTIAGALDLLTRIQKTMTPRLGQHHRSYSHRKCMNGKNNADALSQDTEANLYMAKSAINDRTCVCAASKEPNETTAEGFGHTMLPN